VRPPVPVQRLLAIHQQRSQIYIGITRYADAVAEAERMVEMARTAGDRRAEGQAVVQLAFAHWATLSADHVPAVERLTAEAMALAREVEDDEVLVRGLEMQGGIDQWNGELTAADAKLQEAIQRAERRGTPRLAIWSHVFLAAHADWRGNFAKAEVSLQHAEDVARSVNDGFSELMALAFRCKTHIARGEHTEGLAIIRHGLERARDRDNKFFIGRLENTIGWVHQELGDFAGALEHDRASQDIGQQIKNGNVEISAQINLGFDLLHGGEPERALALLEETQRRAASGFGAHRWRWGVHTAACIAEALIALGRPDEALTQIEQSLAIARRTGSQKYIAKAYALRGDMHLAASRWAEAEADLTEGLRVAQHIGYPTLTWQCAHALSRALLARGERDRAARDGVERAYEMAQLAGETIRSVADRLTDPALVTSFRGWSRVQAVERDLERLGHR